MPFGAEPLDGGGTRFRLWAPGAERVALEPAAGAPRPLAGEGDGWFGLEAPDLGPGARYRFRLDDDALVPDPASRSQPDGVTSPSAVVDPEAYAWDDGAWRGRPWHEAVLYELHPGAFTPEGDYAGIASRLDHLAALGVTALELMPVSDCPGRRNWGYDGVAPFAPAARHGPPEALKGLVDAAHARGLMVFLDVVYNHFGPEGNFLPRVAPPFFTDRHRTPWGDAIDFAGPHSATVRDFFVHNALYWLEEFHLDGLRLDAVHAIRDESSPDFLSELAARVRQAFGAERHVHLVLENDDNEARRLEPEPDAAPRYRAQWNDDFHHACHVLLTGERAGYYADYADRPHARLGRCLAEGFAYQGEPSAFRGGEPRGEPSAHLPATAFVNFLQNHDQIGNRALGERLTVLCPPEALAAAAAVLLLAPSPPLLFMGEEWGATEPFPFFCDFDPPLADQVRDGRRREFAAFPAFREPTARARIPDPGAEATFASAVLRWEARDEPGHRERLALYRALLAIRRREIVPRLEARPGRPASYDAADGDALRVRWRLQGARLALFAHLADRTADGPPVAEPGRLLHASHEGLRDALARGVRPAWSAAWFLDEGTGR